MPLPCPACGFLTVDEDEYGTYNICPVCGWEDDPVQLADPTYKGGANRESLIEAQQAAISEHPLSETSVDGFERDKDWRPVGEVDGIQ